LFNRKRLSQVTIGTRLKRPENIVALVAGSKHNDRHFVIAGIAPHLMHQAEPIHYRHIPVGHQQIKTRRTQRFHRFTAVSGFVHFGETHFF
jgi:hypothetical protein